MGLAATLITCAFRRLHREPAVPPSKRYVGTTEDQNEAARNSGLDCSRLQRKLQLVLKE